VLTNRHLKVVTTAPTETTRPANAPPPGLGFDGKPIPAEVLEGFAPGAYISPWAILGLEDPGSEDSLAGDEDASFNNAENSTATPQRNGWFIESTPRTNTAGDTASGSQPDTVSTFTPLAGNPGDGSGGPDQVSFNAWGPKGEQSRQVKQPTVASSATSAAARNETMPAFAPGNVRRANQRIVPTTKSGWAKIVSTGSLVCRR